ncbi:MAG: protease modulator HflC, partial [Pseudomonadota bacterium]
MRFLPILVLLVGVAGAVALSCIYIVEERTQALVLEFGKVKEVRTEPGLYYKYPAPVNTVVFYDDRILPLETDNLEVNPLDNRRLVVNAFARWRIIDPQRFREAVQTQQAGQDRLEQILNARLRETLGAVNSTVILSERRAQLMNQIRDGSREQAESLGVEIIDVRIRRADLPDRNLQATYDRMEAERAQEAADERARGREAAQIRRATADREAVVLESEARRQGAVIRGEAEAERTALLADAYQRDPEFFQFTESLKAYEEALKGENTSMVISP